MIEIVSGTSCLSVLIVKYKIKLDYLFKAQDYFAHSRQLKTWRKIKCQARPNNSTWHDAAVCVIVFMHSRAVFFLKDIFHSAAIITVQSLSFTSQFPSTNTKIKLCASLTLQDRIWRLKFACMRNWLSLIPSLYHSDIAQVIQCFQSGKPTRPHPLCYLSFVLRSL